MRYLISHSPSAVDFRELFDYPSYTKEHGNKIAKMPFGTPPTEITCELRLEDKLETNKHSFSQYTAKLPDLKQN